MERPGNFWTLLVLVGYWVTGLCVCPCRMCFLWRGWRRRERREGQLTCGNRRKRNGNAHAHARAHTHTHTHTLTHTHAHAHAHTCTRTHTHAHAHAHTHTHTHTYTHTGWGGWVDTLFAPCNSVWYCRTFTTLLTLYTSSQG